MITPPHTLDSLPQARLLLCQFPGRVEFPNMKTETLSATHAYWCTVQEMSKGGLEGVPQDGLSWQRGFQPKTRRVSRAKGMLEENEMLDECLGPCICSLSSTFIYWGFSHAPPLPWGGGGRTSALSHIATHRRCLDDHIPPKDHQPTCVGLWMPRSHHHHTNTNGC